MTETTQTAAPAPKEKEYVRIRNNTARVWTIDDKTLGPGKADVFELEALKPYLNNKATEHAFKVRDLEFLVDPNLALPEERLTQVSKPSPLIGEKDPVDVVDADAIAKLLQSGAPDQVNVNAQKTGNQS